MNQQLVSCDFLVLAQFYSEKNHTRTRARARAWLQTRALTTKRVMWGFESLRSIPRPRKPISLMWRVGFFFCTLIVWFFYAAVSLPMHHTRDTPRCLLQTRRQYHRKYFRCICVFLTRVFFNMFAEKIFFFLYDECESDKAVIQGRNTPPTLCLVFFFLM